MHERQLSFEKRRQQLWDKGRRIVLAAPQLYIDVDVEADGIAGFGSMLSMGAQSPTGESFYSEIRPLLGGQFIEGNRDFCEKHGLEYSRLLKEAPVLSRVMKDFSLWLEDLKLKTGKDTIFTAFNAAYDWGFVNLYFVLSGIEENPFGIAPFDLKSLTLPLAKNWDWKQTSKSKLPQIILPDGDFTHNALEDAKYQQKIHFGLAGLLGEFNYKQITDNN